ncbi:MAG: deoxyribodipyrimidine photo-lyase, partial [Hyphomicrobiales bacterium]|nr:deoxyribodipyrimidine photo-lyase [Hyphomicrobiales bacterium]
MTTIVWFRQDLRLADNPALAYAAARGRVVPVYVLDETPPPDGRPIGGASRWWLHHSLEVLECSLGGLVRLRGAPRDVLPALAKEVDATAIAWNRCYEPYAVARDTALKADLSTQGIAAASFNGSLLFEPWEIETGSGGPFKVYSPFWRACLKMPVAAPLAAPTVELAAIAGLGDSLDDWGLLPTRLNWARGFEPLWRPGEDGARRRLAAFLDKGLSGYASLRNRPDLENVSRLS